MASKEPVSEEDQIWIAQLTGMRPSDIAAMCQRPSASQPEGSQGHKNTPRDAQNLVFRLQSALDTILASGAEVEAIELLESIARWSVASRHAVDPLAEPTKLSPREREAVRAFRVAHPQRTGEIKGAIIEDFSHYEVDEDGTPKKLGQHDPKAPPHSDRDKNAS